MDFVVFQKKSYDTYYPIVLNQNKELPVCDQLVAILHPPTNEDIISVSPGAALEKGKPNDVLEMQLVKQFFIEIHTFAVNRLLGFLSSVIPKRARVSRGV